VVRPTFRQDGLARILAAGKETSGQPAASLAADEDFWTRIQSAYFVDRTMINLNNGSLSPSPLVVEESLRRQQEFINRGAVYNMGLLTPEVEVVRRRLAASFGCDQEEMAITRNTSESLMICQLGLDLKPGDEVLTTDQDYPRMLFTWQQRQKRDGIVLKTIPFTLPVPDLDDLYHRFEKAITPRTRVILLSHMTYVSGQIFPVKKICQMARSRGIETIVDGAHAYAHLPFHVADLDCDYYGTSLHKWLCAPMGTGFLYVRKEKIPRLWPLMPAGEEMVGDIRKFEQIGTHPVAIPNAIGEALTFHEGIGIERKSARLRFLRDRWARRLAEHPRVKLLTSLDPQQSCGMALFDVQGLDLAKLVSHLWEKYRILVGLMRRAEFSGLRIAPNVYTTLEEIDTFCSAVEEALNKKL
jgi:selenocysteine lyase/cysteine desulfurase